MLRRAQWRGLHEAHSALGGRANPHRHRMWPMTVRAASTRGSRGAGWLCIAWRDRSSALAFGGSQPFACVVITGTLRTDIVGTLNHPGAQANCF